MNLHPVKGKVVIVYHMHDSGDLYHTTCEDLEAAQKYIEDELEEPNYCYYIITGDNLQLDFET